ncbi:MAG: hypothetical protein NTY84_10575 [Verrucomicrobia bacterium]|nr:hypothetical protein [Verrucomicrobiota bacterium]
MKPFRTLSLFTATLLLGSASSLADIVEDVKSAASKLADAANYSWTATTEIEGGQWTPAPVKGKAIKGGAAVITSERDGTTTTAVLQGTKGVASTDEGWKTAEELRAAAGGGGGGNRGGMRAGALLRNPLPAASLTKLIEKSKDLKAGEAGVIAGELSDEGAKEFALMGRGGRTGGQTPSEPKNAKGSVQFWLKEGQVQKIRLKVSATMTVNGEDRDMVRTTTWEIRDVGTTTVEVPAEAKKHLGS